MPRPQFTLRALLVAMLVVGALLATWQGLKPPYRILTSSKREYAWRNGLLITISQDGIKIETGVDVDEWKGRRLSELGWPRRRP